MVLNLVSKLNPARLASYEAEWVRLAGPSSTTSRPAVAALYVWQVSLCSAWYETLSYTEAIVRDAVDTTLREWNVDQGHSHDWLDDPSRALAGRVERAAKDASRNAREAARKRSPSHPRANQPVTLDDRVAQLTFGNLVHLFPQAAPPNRARYRSGYDGTEHIWMGGLRAAFPLLTPDLAQGWSSYLPLGLPESVQAGYSVGLALERLRRLRNRVSHHEQTFQVSHVRRLKDANLILGAIHTEAADDVQTLDRVRRTLSMRPSP